MDRFVRISVIFLCLMGFLLVRFCESELFYDPLISFFKGYYQTADLPEMKKGALYLHIILRYAMHMVLSLIILWMVFKEKGILKFAILLYVLVFIFLGGAFVYLLESYTIGDGGALFYVRRFLIQPLMILILLPAFFYYHKVNS